MSPEERQRLEQVYRVAVAETRAELSTDLRALADDFVNQVAALRLEFRPALGLPTPAEPLPDSDQLCGCARCRGRRLQ